MTSASSADFHQIIEKSNPLPTNFSTPLIAPILYNSDSPQMEQQLESLLSKLENPTYDFDLNQAIESLNRLNEILCQSKNLFHVYERYLKENFERIVCLCAKQLHFVNIQIKIRNKIEVIQLEDVLRVQHLLDVTTALLTSLLRDYRQFDDVISRETLNQLLGSMLLYLIWYRNSKSMNWTMRGIDGQAVYYLVKDILSGGSNGIQNDSQPKLVSPLQIGLLTVMFCKFRKMTLGTMQRNSECAKLVRQSNLTVDALASLIKCDHSAGLYFPPNLANLNEFIYEIYAIYEMCHQIVNYPYMNNVQAVISSIQYYIIWICLSLGADRIWMHFELVDKEIQDLKTNPEQVELFKFMASVGYTRVVESKNIKQISGSAVNLLSAAKILETNSRIGSTNHCESTTSTNRVLQ